MPVIYSTCAADNCFPKYDNHPRIASYKESVTIKGGAGVQNKLTLLTPMGAATVVSDAELKWLKSNQAFMRFVEEGYMVIDEKASRAHDSDIEKVVKDEMTERDNSAQDTDRTYAKLGKKAPKKED